MNAEPIWLWVAFNLFVIFMLALDLGVFHRKAHTVEFKEAISWSVVWVSVALMFNAIIYFFWHQMVPGSDYSNSEAALSFFTGYLIEKSLSVDNLFVFVLVFTYFKVPEETQHRVLFWGVLGAIIMRAILIAVGVSLIERFHWIIYLFGAFLIYTGIKMGTQKDEHVNPEDNPVFKFCRRFLPVSEAYEGNQFFVRRLGKLMVTPLFLVLMVVESTDLVFAVDSIPAILAVTKDTFILYTSNVLAILGLRALYFVLAGVMDMFHYLKLGLAVILSFVGTKMLIEGFYHIPIHYSLLFIVATLTIAVVASILRAKRLASETSASVH